MTPKTLAATAALLALLATPLADGTYAFGTLVDKNDADFQPEPSIRTTTGAVGTKIFLPCYVDDDADGKPTAGEALYLAVYVVTVAPIACNDVKAKYVRLTAVPPYAAGTEVKAVDADMHVTLTQLGTAAMPAHAVRVFNGDGQPTLRKGDTVYLDITNLPAMVVSVGDIRLGAFGSLPAGTRVRDGDADLNSPLGELGGGVATKTLYTASILYEYGKSWYINNDMDAATKGVEEGDLRLTGNAINFMGDLMASIGNPGKVVESITAMPDVARPGQIVYVTVIVKNPTAKVGSALVETQVDGLVVDSRGTPSLAKDESAKLVIAIPAPQEPGRHKIQSGDSTFILDVVGPSSTVEADSAVKGAVPVASQVVAAPASVPALAKDAPAGASGTLLVVLACCTLAMGMRIRRTH